MRKLVLCGLLLVLAVAGVSARQTQERRFGVEAALGYDFSISSPEIFSPANSGVLSLGASYDRSYLGVKAKLGGCSTKDSFTTSKDGYWRKGDPVSVGGFSVVYGYAALDALKWRVMPSVKASHLFDTHKGVDSITDKMSTLSLQAGCSCGYAVYQLRYTKLLICVEAFAGADRLAGYGWAPSVNIGVNFAINQILNIK